MLVLPDAIIGKPVGFTCSTWDLLHAGHILMLAEAKTVCNYLIVGLQSDPTIDRPEIKNKPVQSVVERYVQLSAVILYFEFYPTTITNTPIEYIVAY